MFKQFMRLILIIWGIFIAITLVFISIGKSRNNDVVSFVAVFDNRADIFIYDPVSNELTNITRTRFTEYGIAWSQSGILSFSESGNPARVFDALIVMDRLGDGRVIEMTETLLSYGIVWSPDNHTIAYYSSHPRNISDIYTISFPDATIQNITQTEAISESQPLWLADGGHLIYQQDGNLYVLNLLTNERHLIANIEGLTIEDPVLSPDGRFIAFYTQTWQNNQAISNAFILALESGEIEALDLPETINSALSWSPNSDSFVFVGENTHLLIYDIVDHSLERVEGENRRFSPVWSPSGRWIAFIENRQLHFYDLQREIILNTNTGGRIREPLIWRP